MTPDERVALAKEIGARTKPRFVVDTSREDPRQVSFAKAKRLVGNVLYWTFSALAVLVVVLFASVVIDDDMIRGVAPDTEPWLLVFAVVAAVVIWLIGRACRYVLAGR
jgi:hypothetical protein